MIVFGIPAVSVFEPCSPPTPLKHQQICNKIDVSPTNSPHHFMINNQTLNVSNIINLSNHPKSPILTWLRPHLLWPTHVAYFLWHEKTTKNSSDLIQDNPQARATKGATVRFQKVASNWHKELISKEWTPTQRIFLSQKLRAKEKGKKDHPSSHVIPLGVYLLIPHEHFYLEQWTCDRFDDHPYALIGEEWLNNGEAGKPEKFSSLENFPLSSKVWRFGGTKVW